MNIVGVDDFTRQVPREQLNRVITHSFESEERKREQAQTQRAQRQPGNRPPLLLAQKIEQKERGINLERCATCQRCAGRRLRAPEIEERRKGEQKSY